MFRNRKDHITIRVALDSIIYAPLYVFVQRNSLNPNAKFHFYIEPVHTGIKLVPRHKLRSSLSVYSSLSSLRLIEEDPVFSPVCDETQFDDEPRTWFGVGDPLRAWRLKLFRHSTIAFDFVGTLVCRLAFWIIAERKCEIAPDYLADFNYVTCHSKGMTGYYVTEALFRTDGNNPIAPVYAPGQEVDQLFTFLAQDWPRRIDEATDPVWVAAVSTEIGRILTLQKLHKKHHPTEIQRLHKSNDLEKLPSDFLLTALVARKDENNSQEIDASAKYLKEGIMQEIKQLRKAPNEFCNVLAKFYRSHASFALPAKNSRPFLLERQMRRSRIAKEIRDIYPTDQLIAPKLSKLGTDWLLLQAIIHDIQEGTDDSIVLDIFERFRPDTWQAEGSLWST